MSSLQQLVHSKIGHSSTSVAVEFSAPVAGSTSSMSVVLNVRRTKNMGITKKMQAQHPRLPPMTFLLALVFQNGVTSEDASPSSASVSSASVNTMKNRTAKSTKKSTKPTTMIEYP